MGWLRLLEVERLLRRDLLLLVKIYVVSLTAVLCLFHWVLIYLDFFAPLIYILL